MSIVKITDKKKAKEDVIKRIKQIQNKIPLPTMKQQAMITRKFKKQSDLTKFILLVAELGSIDVKFTQFIEELEKLPPEKVIGDTYRIVK